MKLKILLGTFVLCCVEVFSESVPALIVSADGAETKYPLSAVQRIVIAEGAQPTFTVERKDGAADVTGGRTLQFGSMDVPMALAETGKIPLYVYPNPVSDYLQLSGAEKAEIRLFDVNGSLLQTTHDAQINVSELTSGTYFLQIDGQILKFVKK